MEKLEKVIVVCGPTATGKSDYAVALAKKIGTVFTPQSNSVCGEIISADSRQVYRGLDIGSGKITKREMRGVPHHLLDVASPRRVFSVAQFQKKAEKAIHDIVKRGNIPIVCGGTGFYIDALIYGTDFPAVPPNKLLRKKLSVQTAQENFEYLQTLDPDRAETVDRYNNVRIIRAIEIALALGSVPKVTQTKKYDVEWHYLDFPDDVLRKRIHDRLIKRIKQGMVTEVHTLHENGLSWKRLEALGLEYRYVALYLQKKLSRQEMLTQLEYAIWHYAKRQRTWFKKYMRAQ